MFSKNETLKAKGIAILLLLFHHLCAPCGARFFHYRGQEVSVKATDTLVEIYYNHERIATHTKFPEYRSNAWSTHKEDMPDEYNQPEMDEERIKIWAASIGENAAEVIDRIFRSVNIKEQGYNSALSVLKLSKPYSEKRLETACEIALSSIR